MINRKVGTICSSLRTTYLRLIGIVNDCRGLKKRARRQS